MFQVRMTASGGGPTIDFGPKVETLVQASVVVEVLDWLWQQWIASDCDEPTVEAVTHYEGSDVTATDLSTGDVYYNATSDEVDGEHITAPGWHL